MTQCDDQNCSDIVYTCEKHQVRMCATCAYCRDPELFCKFRPSCMIHFLDKERARDAKTCMP
jgi:hypothetical protein